jgi:hypothetical protein
MGWGVVFHAGFYLPEMLRAFSGCVNYKATPIGVEIWTNRMS